MCKHWGLHISTNINCLGSVLGSFWAVWRGLLWCLKVKLRSWQFLRYWWFNKQYYGGYQLIFLISQPLLMFRNMTGIDQKVFSRAFCSHWDCKNHQRIDEDMAEWSLWQLLDDNHIADTCTHCHVFLDHIQSRKKPVQGLENDRQE